MVAQLSAAAPPTHNQLGGVVAGVAQRQPSQGREPKEASAAHMAAKALHMSSDMASSSGATYSAVASLGFMFLGPTIVQQSIVGFPNSFGMKPLTAHYMLSVP